MKIMKENEAPRTFGQLFVNRFREEDRLTGIKVALDTIIKFHSRKTY